MRVLIILFLISLVNIGYCLDIGFGVGMSFYGDGIGGLFKVSLIENKLLGVNSVFGSVGLMGEYALGSDNDYYVSVFDVGLFLGVGWLYMIERFGFGLGMDLGDIYFYGANVKGDTLMSIVFRIIPKGIVSYCVDNFSVLGEIGYSAGISSFYLGNIYVMVGVNLNI